MERHLLSKSTFIRGVQCLKSLYLNKKRPFLRDKMPQERLLVFKRGHEVGKLAHQLFPGGINLSPGHPSAYRKAVLNTTEKVSEGFPVIYEAGFQHQQVLILLDILVRTASGWHAYEVKSSKGISDTYLMDAALQYYVLRGSGLELEKISIIHIDKAYVRKGELDPGKLFKIVDVTDEAISRQEFIHQHIEKEKETLKLAHSPKIDVGPHCRQPYDCDFIGHCWKKIPEEPIKPMDQQFDLPGLKKAIDKDIEDLCFLKVLPMKPAIPMYEDCTPYQEISFGYKIAQFNGEFHEGKIFESQTNPETALKTELHADLKDIRTIVCFGQEELLKGLCADQTILDIRNFLHEGSNYFNQRTDIPEIEKLMLLLDKDEIDSKPEYLSDAIAASYYLNDNDVKNARLHLEEYMTSYLGILSRIFKHLAK
jgi:hypothetical protein